jgi:hypothetical protein
VLNVAVIWNIYPLVHISTGVSEEYITSSFRVENHLSKKQRANNRMASETSVHILPTGRYNPEDGNIHTYRCENLNSYIYPLFLIHVTIRIYNLFAQNAFFLLPRDERKNQGRRVENSSNLLVNILLPLSLFYFSAHVERVLQGTRILGNLEIFFQRGGN